MRTKIFENLKQLKIWSTGNLCTWPKTVFIYNSITTKICLMLTHLNLENNFKSVLNSKMLTFHQVYEIWSSIWNRERNEWWSRKRNECRESNKWPGGGNVVHPEKSDGATTFSFLWLFTIGKILNCLFPGSFLFPFQRLTISNCEAPLWYANTVFLIIFIFVILYHFLTS